MLFESLPADWPQRPLTDPEIAAGVVDLCTPERDRHAGTLVMLLCHPSGRLMQPVVVNDVPIRLPTPEKARTWAGLLHAAVSCRASVVLAVGARQPRLTTEVVAWVDEARAACAAHDVPLLGIYLASRGDVAALHLPATEAA
ncbi:MAG: hypothetical protein M9891_12895 [Austwickia sp.]|nr:hypothetical protein [Actinomycetota bacterium]MCB1254264.1 hypothetical protein [Austwickia sp.]MCO5310155.1 hypothetical protein [Austwickia sp.]